ncbi:MAG: helix-turn-helix transcriptional regulator [Pseudomonadota bacterium]
MLDLHARLKVFIKATDFDYKSLSLAIGQGERYISNLLSSKSDPGYSNVVKICAALGTTPNQLAGIGDEIDLTASQIDHQIARAQAEHLLTLITREARRKLSAFGARPLLDDVMNWWHEQKGVLTNFDLISEHVDLYLAPSAEHDLPTPYRLGSASLAAESFGIQTAEQLREILSILDEGLVKNIKMAHAQTSGGDPKLSIEDIDILLPGHHFASRFLYKRLLLPVRDTKGRKFVLNYSRALS